MPVIYYVIDETKYVDFKTLKEITRRSRTFINDKLVEVRRVCYQNRLLFNYEDLKTTEIIRFL